MKAPTCKICGTPHRLGPCPQTADDENGEAVQRRKSRTIKSPAQAARDAMLDRPLRDFLDEPALIEQVPLEPIKILYRGAAKMVMRAKRRQT